MNRVADGIASTVRIASLLIAAFLALLLTVAMLAA